MEYLQLIWDFAFTSYYWYIAATLPIIIYISQIIDGYKIFNKDDNIDNFKENTRFLTISDFSEFLIVLVFFIFWPLSIFIFLSVLIYIDKFKDKSILVWLLLKWDKHKNPEKYI